MLDCGILTPSKSQDSFVVRELSADVSVCNVNQRRTSSDESLDVAGGVWGLLGTKGPKRDDARAPRRVHNVQTASRVVQLRREPYVDSVMRPCNSVHVAL